jgi:ParB family chromosome partitioning protein
MQMVAIERLQTRSQARRKRDAEKQIRLNKSVLLHGVLQSLLVKPVDDYLLVLAGEGRLIAAKAAGLKEVPVRIWQGAAGLDRLVQLIENDVRSDICESDRFQAVMDIKESNPDWTGKELARQLSESPVTISKMFKVRESFVPVGLDAFLSGRISLGRAYEIACECDLVQHEMVRACLDGTGATRETLQTISRKARNTGLPQERVNKVRCIMDGGVVQISGKDLDLDSAVEIVQAWLKKAKKALESGWNASTLQAACKAEAGA